MVIEILICVKDPGVEMGSKSLMFSSRFAFGFWNRRIHASGTVQSHAGCGVGATRLFGADKGPGVGNSTS